MKESSNAKNNYDKNGKQILKNIMAKIYLKFLEDLDEPSVIGLDDIILILQFVEKYGNL